LQPHPNPLLRGEGIIRKENHYGGANDYLSDGIQSSAAVQNRKTEIDNMKSDLAKIDEDLAETKPIVQEYNDKLRARKDLRRQLAKRESIFKEIIEFLDGLHSRRNTRTGTKNRRPGERRTGEAMSLGHYGYSIYWTRRVREALGGKAGTDANRRCERSLKSLSISDKVTNEGVHIIRISRGKKTLVANFISTSIQEEEHE